MERKLVFGLLLRTVALTFVDPESITSLWASWMELTVVRYSPRSFELSLLILSTNCCNKQESDVVTLSTVLHNACMTAIVPQALPISCGIQITFSGSGFVLVVVSSSSVNGNGNKRITAKQGWFTKPKSSSSNPQQS